MDTIKIWKLFAVGVFLVSFLLLLFYYNNSTITQEQAKSGIGNKAVKVFLSFDLERDPRWATELNYSFKGVENVDNLLDVLDKHKIKATFFLSGEVVDKYPSAIKEIVKRGHELGVHGAYYHDGEFEMAVLENYPPEYQRKLIEETVNLIKNTAGVEPIGFRSPGFRYNEDTTTALLSLGIEYDSSENPEYGVKVGPGIVEFPITCVVVEGVYSILRKCKELNIDYRLRSDGLEKTTEIVKKALEDARNASGIVVIYAHPSMFVDLPNKPKDYKASAEVLLEFDQFLRWLNSQNTTFVTGQRLLYPSILLVRDPRAGSHIGWRGFKAFLENRKFPVTLINKAQINETLLESHDILILPGEPDAKIQDYGLGFSYEQQELIAKYVKKGRIALIGTHYLLHSKTKNEILAGLFDAELGGDGYVSKEKVVSSHPVTSGLNVLENDFDVHPRVGKKAKVLMKGVNGAHEFPSAFISPYGKAIYFAMGVGGRIHPTSPYYLEENRIHYQKLMLNTIHWLSFGREE